MTPAEQGQEKLGRCSVKRVEMLEMELAGCQRELEMCQRYFPFLQRSRADYKRRYEEAVKREKALVGALERIAKEGMVPGGRAHMANIARAALDQSGKGARR